MGDILLWDVLGYTIWGFGRDTCGPYGYIRLWERYTYAGHTICGPYTAIREHI
jgi:hypothetical protein